MSQKFVRTTSAYVDMKHCDKIIRRLKNSWGMNTSTALNIELKDYAEFTKPLSEKYNLGLAEWEYIDSRLVSEIRMTAMLRQAGDYARPWDLARLKFMWI